jgi:hypothetical protein
MPRSLLGGPVLALLLVAAAPAEPVSSATDAAPAKGATDEWEFIVVPYFWAAGLEGTVEAHGVSADVDVSFSDIWDALDLGALGAFEARRSRLSLSTNAVFMKMSDDADRPVGPGLGAFPPGSLDADVVSKTFIGEAAAGYEVLSLPVFGAAHEQRLALDLRAGLRYWWLDNDVDVTLTPGVPLGPFERSVDETTDWVDLLVGARARAKLTDRIGLVVSGDYGGFSIGSSSDYTWSIAAFANYRFAERWAVEAGWRKIKIDRDFGDLGLEGPLAGCSYRF